MQLRDEISQASDGIEAGEVKTAQVVAIIKKLLPKSKITDERAVEARRVGQADDGRGDRGANLAVLHQGHVRGIIDGHAGLQSERLIPLDSLQDRLLAEIRIIWAGRGVILIDAFGGDIGRRLKGGFGSQQSGPIGRAALRPRRLARRNYRKKEKNWQGERTEEAPVFHEAAPFRGPRPPESSLSRSRIAAPDHRSKQRANSP